MKITELTKKLMEIYKEANGGICIHTVDKHINSILNRIDISKIQKVEKYHKPKKSVPIGINTVNSRLGHGIIYYDIMVNDKHIYYHHNIDICIHCDKLNNQDPFGPVGPFGPSQGPWKNSTLEK